MDNKRPVTFDKREALFNLFILCLPVFLALDVLKKQYIFIAACNNGLLDADLAPRNTIIAEVAEFNGNMKVSRYTHAHKRIFILQ
jgi:hypothetical protein